MEQETEKMFFHSIIAFELRAASSHNSEKDTCHRQSPLRFLISLRETFSKSVSPKVMEN